MLMRVNEVNKFNEFEFNVPVTISINDVCSIELANSTKV